MIHCTTSFHIYFIYNFSQFLCLPQRQLFTAFLTRWKYLPRVFNIRRCVLGINNSRQATIIMVRVQLRLQPMPNVNHSITQNVIKYVRTRVKSVLCEPGISCWKCYLYLLKLTKLVKSHYGYKNICGGLVYFLASCYERIDFFAFLSIYLLQNFAQLCTSYMPFLSKKINILKVRCKFRV